MLKDRILAKVSQMDIFKKYISPDIKLNRNIISPLRNERTASFGLYQYNGTILFKDFAGEGGDCFKFVMLKYDIGFIEACKIIANDFGISFTGPIPKRKVMPLLTIPKIQHAEFEFKEKAIDSDYWNQFNITPRILDEYNVVGIESVKGSTWKGTIYSDSSNPIFCYKYPSGRVRFYRPLSSSLKHFGNVGRDDVFGMDLLNGPIVICAGQKDVMSLYANTGVRGISLNSESASLDEKVYLQLRMITQDIFVCYDNDDTGYKNMNMLSNAYNIKQIKLIDIYPDLPIKQDLSWYFKHEKKENFNKLIQIIYDNKMQNSL